jgi:hypothetical protein
MEKFSEYLDRKNASITNENDNDFDELDYTKEDIIDLLDEMSPEDINDLAYFIMDELYDEEDDDMDDMDDMDEDELSEIKYFDKKKRELNVAKKQDRSSRRKRARELKKYYKKNKSKIKVKASRYRKKIKRNPKIVTKHRN